MKTAERDRNEAKRDTAGVTPRARALLRRDVTVSRRDSERDTAVTVTARLEAGPSPSRLAGDRRFDGWLAGASAEQQARWERMQAGAKVEDETLPPALRGGALGAF